MFMMYLDLSEIDEVLSLSALWGRDRWRLARFRRDDYLSVEGLGLAESVRAQVEAKVGWRPSGPIRMLTHLRYFGFIFNPVTFYYCFDDSGRVEVIVAQITNTPWGERHVYVLDARGKVGDGAGVRRLRWRFDKEFHVSPFMPMDLEYDWSFGPPGESLFVHMNLRDQTAGRKTFDSTMRMQRREISAGALRNHLLMYPLMTARVLGRIHFEAMRLWLKRAAVFAHPGTRRQAAGTAALKETTS